MVKAVLVHKPNFASLREKTEKKILNGAKTVATAIDSKVKANLNDQYLGYGYGNLSQESGAITDGMDIVIGTGKWYGKKWETGDFPAGFIRAVRAYTNVSKLPKTRKLRKMPDGSFKMESQSDFEKRVEKAKFFLEINNADGKYRGHRTRPFLKDAINNVDFKSAFVKGA